ncbi:MAG: hypothetical protein ABSD43_15015 [Terracidiphilus sp.]|jgi:hypothetical protein
MTNIFGEQKKHEVKRELFQRALEALAKDGWKIERMAGLGKSSVRRIVKGGITKTVSIRTSQDTWIAFPRNQANDGWATLGEVDYVVAASVDDRIDPRFAQVHLIEGGEMRDRFDRAYAARKSAGHSLPRGRGMWVSLYHKESDYPVNRVGAGAGLSNAPIARVPLGGQRAEPSSPPREVATSFMRVAAEDAHISIAEAKRLLALSLGVNEADVRITITS